MSLDYAAAEEEVEYCASFSMISKNDDVIYMYRYNIVNIGLGLDATTDEEDCLSFRRYDWDVIR